MRAPSGAGQAEQCPSGRRLRPLASVLRWEIPAAFQQRPPPRWPNLGGGTRPSSSIGRASPTGEYEGSSPSRGIRACGRANRLHAAQQREHAGVRTRKAHSTPQRSTPTTSHLKRRGRPLSTPPSIPSTPPSPAPSQNASPEARCHSSVREEIHSPQGTENQPTPPSRPPTHRKPIRPNPLDQWRGSLLLLPTRLGGSPPGRPRVRPASPDRCWHNDLHGGDRQAEGREDHRPPGWQAQGVQRAGPQALPAPRLGSGSPRSSHARAAPPCPRSGRRSPALHAEG